MEGTGIDELFREWLHSREQDVLQLLRREGTMSASALAAALKLSERAAVSVIYRMARQGAIKITGIQVAT